MSAGAAVGSEVMAEAVMDGGEQVVVPVLVSVAWREASVARSVPAMAAAPSLATASAPSHSAPSMSVSTTASDPSNAHFAHRQSNMAPKRARNCRRRSAKGAAASTQATVSGSPARTSRNATTPTVQSRRRHELFRAF
eukprot:scaffold8425_cov107-Isochrysis_galbana.AAC.3